MLGRLIWVLLVLLPCVVAEAAKPPLGRVFDPEAQTVSAELTAEARRELGSESRAAEATIHWQGVPLRDVVERLQGVFGESIFVDRRVDPSQRVSLDIEGGRFDEVLRGIAAPRELGFAQLSSLIYLGPREAAEQLRPLATLRAEEVARMPKHQRVVLERAAPFRWQRLAEPRQVVTALVADRGWRVANAERIPHDLWDARPLPEMPLSEQLTVLLIGFDLTFELRRERAVEIVPLDAAQMAKVMAGAKPPLGHELADEWQADVGAKAAAKPDARVFGGTKQVYTLRVAEQPVRAVLDELTRRLKWRIDIDEAAIQAAGRSLEARVTFAVENAGQDELLAALLRPAGLGFRRAGERIVIEAREAE